MITVLEDSALVVWPWVVAIGITLGILTAFIVAVSAFKKEKRKGTGQESDESVAAFVAIILFSAMAIGVVSLFVSIFEGATRSFSDVDRVQQDFYEQYDEVDAVYQEDDKITDIQNYLLVNRSGDGFNAEPVTVFSAKGEETSAYLAFTDSDVEGASHTVSLAVRSDDNESSVIHSPHQLVEFNTGQNVAEISTDFTAEDVNNAGDDRSVIAEHPILSGLIGGGGLLLVGLVTLPAIGFAKKRATKVSTKLAVK